MTGLRFSADNVIDHTEGYIRTIKSIRYAAIGPPSTVIRKKDVQELIMEYMLF